LNSIISYKTGVCTIAILLGWAVNAQTEQTCLASFYHSKFQGKKMSNGFRFNNDSYTCAHKTLPIGTKVEITNLENGKYVVATVTDRGPFIKNRCVDVTFQIAKDLDFVAKGTTKVSVRVLQEEPLWRVIKSSDSLHYVNRYGLKIGTFINYAEAALAARKIKDCCGVNIYLGRITNSEKSFVLIAGNFATPTEAQNLTISFPQFLLTAEVFEYNTVLDALK
jgi:rare lipoprotein A